MISLKHKSIGQRRRDRARVIKVIVAAGSVIILLCVIMVIVLNHSKGTSLVAETETSQVIQTTVTAEQTASAEPTTTPSPTPEPTSTPTPSPTPTPAFLTSLEGYAPGDVIDEELIDADNLSQYFSINEIQEGDSVYQRIYGQSYVDNNDIALSDLRYLTMLHVNFDGQYQVGEMIVNAQVAQQVTEIFEQLLAARYEIYSMYLIDDFWVGNGTDSDTNSIDHNNTSCFCYRPATGSSNISRHALGLAIDINPQQNPYVRILSDGSLDYSHENAAEFVSNRTSDTPHVITYDDYAYQLFSSYGWTWGGNWNNPRDYQHFQV